MRARVLSHKLGFVQRTIRNENGISSFILQAVAAEDVCDSLTVKECLEWGKPSAGLQGEEVGDPSRDVKAKSWEITISQAEKHPEYGTMH